VNRGSQRISGDGEVHMSDSVYIERESLGEQ
jgi:hypothetical protein